MLPHPCPCTTLQCGVKAVAIFSAVSDILSTILLFILEAFNASHILIPMEVPGTVLTSHSLLIILLICHIISLVLDIVLYYGAEKRNDIMCWAWLGFTLLFFLFVVIITILKHSGYYSAIPREGLDTDVVSDITEIAIFIYFLYVVYAFIMEIRNQPDPQLNPVYQVSTMAQPQGSVYRAMEAGTYYTAGQPNYPIESQTLNQPQPTSAPAL